MTENIDNVMARINQIYQRIDEIRSFGRVAGPERVQETAAKPNETVQEPGRSFTDALEKAMVQDALAGLSPDEEAADIVSRLGQTELQTAARITGEGLKEGRYGTLIKIAADFFGVDSELVKAVIRQESEFNPRAVSPKGAMGLMQLMPDTAKMLGIDDPFDPAKNIYGGTKFLRSMIDRFNGNLKYALAAYNAGPNAVDAAGGVPDFPETKNYVEKVIQYYMGYKGGE